MTRTIKAEDDVWRVRLGDRPRDGRRSVLFLCTSNSQRPWRVVEVDAGRFPDPESLDALSEAELGALFDESRSMDFPRTWA